MSKPKSQGPDREFLKLATGREEDALAYQLMSAFGVSLETCFAVVMSVMKNKDAKLIVMMLTAGVQVRSNVTFVGPKYANIRDSYPSLIIEGSRGVDDVFNFSALHVCGHIIALFSSDPLCENISKKAGNCASGEHFTANDAGKINKEIFMSWSSESVKALMENVKNNKDGIKVILDPVVLAIKSKGAQFGKDLMSAQKPAIKAGEGA